MLVFARLILRNVGTPLGCRRSGAADRDDPDRWWAPNAADRGARSAVLLPSELPPSGLT